MSLTYNAIHVPSRAVKWTAEGVVHYVDITRDGKNIVSIAETGIYNIWAAPRADLSKARQITYGEVPMIWVAEAQYGKLLSVSWNFDLWVMNPDGSQRVPFGDVRSLVRCFQAEPLFTPPGSRVVGSHHCNQLAVI